MILSNYNEVPERNKQEALVRLQERISAGEQAADILQIEPTHGKYYIDKMCKGLVPMSYVIYDRIMGCSLEDKELTTEQSKT